MGRGLGGTRLRGNKVKGEGGGDDKIKGGGTRLMEGDVGNKIKGEGNLSPLSCAAENICAQPHALPNLNL